MSGKGSHRCILKFIFHNQILFKPGKPENKIYPNSSTFYSCEVCFYFKNFLQRLLKQSIFCH